MSYYIHLDETEGRMRMPAKPVRGAVRYHWSWPGKGYSLCWSCTEPNDSMYGTAVSGAMIDASGQWFDGVKWRAAKDGLYDEFINVGCK